MSSLVGERIARLVVAGAICLLGAAVPGAGAAAAQSVYQGLPAPLRRIAFEQRLGEPVDLRLAFRDESGADVSLGELTGDRPIVLALVYYDCPMLCSLTLDGLVSSLRAIELDAGSDFDVVVASIDPGEQPSLARATRARALESYRRAGTESGWHFLTGDQASIDALTDSVGFRYSRDEQTGEYAHAAGIVVLTPSGRISRYLLGIEFPARDLRLSLIESSDGGIGTLVDQALLFCYRYDPETGTYSAAAMNLVRAGGVLTVLILVIFVLLTLRRDRRAARFGEPGHVA